MNRNYSWKA